MHAFIGVPPRKETVDTASTVEQRLKRLEMRQKVLEQHVQYLISVKERELIESSRSADKEYDD